jgi:hypothetical protein
MWFGGDLRKISETWEKRCKVTNNIWVGKRNGGVLGLWKRAEWQVGGGCREAWIERFSVPGKGRVIFARLGLAAQFGPGRAGKGAVR